MSFRNYACQMLHDRLRADTERYDLATAVHGWFDEDLHDPDAVQGNTLRLSREIRLERVGPQQIDFVVAWKGRVVYRDLADAAIADAASAWI